MNEERKLIKVDRNGSKHYEGMVTCPRCGGSGIFFVAVHNGQGVPARPDAGVCYKCGGSGKVKGKWIERTPEYQAKLDARREAKQKKKMEELEAKRKAEYDSNYKESLQKNGFNSDGKTFIFLGDTYSRKEEIKAAGGKFDPIALGWHIDHKIDGFDFIEADVSEIASVSAWGRLEISADGNEWNQKKLEAQKQINGEGAGFFGNIGDRIKIDVELVRSSSHEVKINRMKLLNYIHVMKDADGHIFVWKTANPLEKPESDTYEIIQEGEHFSIKGTVKDHCEYRDQMQTVLTRCKIA